MWVHMCTKWLLCQVTPFNNLSVGSSPTFILQQWNGLTVWMVDGMARWDFTFSVTCGERTVLWTSIINPLSFQSNYLTFSPTDICTIGILQYCKQWSCEGVKYAPGRGHSNMHHISTWPHTLRKGRSCYALFCKWSGWRGRDVHVVNSQWLKYSTVNGQSPPKV